MDKKALLILKDFHQTIISRTFTENDIVGFLIFIRESLPQTSDLKELCHFIAHRNRTQGVTYRFVDKVEKALNSHHTISVSDVFENENIFYSHRTIKQELNSLFVSFNMEELGNLVIVEFMVCLISILQTISLFKSDGTKFCELSMWVYKNKVLLLASIDWTLVSSGSVVPFGVPIIGVGYETGIMPEDAEESSCITRPEPFTIKRVSDRLMIE